MVLMPGPAKPGESSSSGEAVVAMVLTMVPMMVPVLNSLAASFSSL